MHTINGTSWIKSRHSDLLPGDTNVNEYDPKINMFEKTERMSCISTSKTISAMNERIQIDFTELPKVRRCKYLLVIVDQLTHWVEAFPTTRATAQAVAKILLEQIIP